MRVRLVILFATACIAQAATISGVVTDALTHLPLQGAAIRANGGIARTDIEGRYELAVPPATAVQLAVSRNGYAAPATVGGPVTVRSGETLERNFELRPLMKISGVVEDYATGERISGCHVFAMRRIYALGRAWHVPAGLITADTRNGKFEIRNLEPGEYVLEIVPENIAPIPAHDTKSRSTKKFNGWSYYPDANRLEMAAPITVTEGADVPVTIRLRKREPRSVSGTATLPVSIELVRYGLDERRTVASGTLFAAGPFRIDDLSDGDYHLVAHAANGMVADVPLSLGDRDITDVRVAPAPGPTISGTVRTADSAMPLPPKLRFEIAPIYPLYPLDTMNSQKEVDVTDGHFEVVTDTEEFEARITGLPEGYAAAAGLGPRLDYTIVKTGSLSGKLKDGDEYILLPGGTTLIGEFTIDLAPGKYQIAKLEGDEPKLISKKEFLQAKAAAATATIEIKGGETTPFQP
jgi:carboxypeptidase family protein